MFLNKNNKFVLTEKVFDFEKNFSVLFFAKHRTNTVYGPIVSEYKEYWYVVYGNGNSAALKREIKNQYEISQKKNNKICTNIRELLRTSEFA